MYRSTSTAFLVAFLLMFNRTNAQNIDLVGHLAYPDVLNDIWGWTDPLGVEYALVGVHNGFSIVDVTTTPADPTELFFVPGPNSTWRDIKTWGNYAYVVHDNVDPGSPGAPGIGLLIVDLSNLPLSIDTLTIKDFGGGVRFDHAHNIYIDEFGTLYLFGANYGNGGAIMLDLTADPELPTLQGVYDLQYVHDGFARDNVLWTAEINVGHFAVVDVSNKALPVLLSTQTSPGNFTHNVWLSDDDQTLFTTDEIAEGYLGAYDVSDLGDIQELDRWRSNPGSGIVPHNSFVYGDFLVTSYYRDGVTVHDISRPGNMVLVGLYDTSPLVGFGYDGCWGVYPYNPSGRIFASDVLTGLYVLDPSYPQAAWVEGLISNASTSVPVPNAVVTIDATTAQTESDITGQYGTGWYAAGTYSITVSADGYTPRTISGVVLTPGVVTPLDIELDPLPVTTVSGQITDAASGSALAGVSVAFLTEDFRFDAVTDASGQYSISGIYALPYEVVAGKWGYISTSSTLDLSTTSEWDAELSTGIYDDFTFSFGWSSIGSTWAGGAWERDNPIAYDPGYGYPITPGVDDADDPGRSCYVTGNQLAQDIVHAGEVLLRSPEFDPRGIDEATIRFTAWVFNTDLNGLISNDGLIVRLSDAASTVAIDTIWPVSADDPQWQTYEYRVEDFKTPGPGMRVLFSAKSDGFPFFVEDVLECAVDHFRVEAFDTGTGLVTVGEPVVSSRVFPNPASDMAWIELDPEQAKAMEGNSVWLHVQDLTGRLVENRRQIIQSGRLMLLTSPLPAGLYSFTIQDEAQLFSSGRFMVYR